MTTAPADPLREAAAILEAAALDLPLAPADRAYLSRVARRLGELADAIDAPPARKPAPPVVPLPERFVGRTEAARRLGVHPNTLLNWEARGLLTPRTDARGWRVYGAEELERGLAIVAHTPPDALP